jgi:hypothetical protein
MKSLVKSVIINGAVAAGFMAFAWVCNEKATNMLIKKLDEMAERQEQKTFDDDFDFDE